MMVNSATETSAVPQSTSKSSVSKKDAMGKDMFLKLMITQLKYQDPLSPQSNTEFTSQMAQFSSLEQLTNVNTNLASLSQINSSVANAQSLAMIGKEVKAAGNTVEVHNSSSSAITFSLPSDVGTSSIHITNSAGEVVATLNGGTLASGEHTVQWNAKDNAGNWLPDGTYTYAVDAKSVSGQTVDATTFMRGIVKSVSNDKGITYLQIGTGKVLTTDVMEVGQAAASAKTN